MPGAGRLRLARDREDPSRFVSFGRWESSGAAHAWKASPDFRERMSHVQRHVAEFKPAELRDALTGALSHRGPALVDVVTDPNALSLPPHITGAQVRGFALAATRTVLDGGVGKMIELARTNLRNIPRR